VPTSSSNTLHPWGRYNYFLEAVRNNPERRRFLPKLQAYLLGRGEYYGKLDIKRYRVLILTTSDARRDNLLRMIKKAFNDGEGNGLFLLAAELEHTTPATIEVLPEVVAAVDSKAEVYLDGGIRRGTDIYKALALGARSVLIGRPLFWGLAVDGEAGALAVLEMLRDELDGTMGMCGRPTFDSIDKEGLDALSPLLSTFPQPAEFR